MSDNLVTFGDIKRLLTEMSEGDVMADSAKWCEDNNVDPSLIGEYLHHQISSIVLALLRRDLDLHDVPALLCLSGFLIGWESHKQFGQRVEIHEVE